MWRRLFHLLSFISVMVLVVAKGAIEHLSDKKHRPSPNLVAASADSYSRDLKRFSFGFDSLMAATHWVDLLQRARHQHQGSETLSWEYVQLDAITTLDPKFERAYVYGGVTLSVLVQDKIGALRILEKWARRWPLNWRVQYILGYHLFFEMKNYEAASRHILKAAELEGAPSWLNALAVRLLSETGALAESIRLCVELYDQVPDTEGKDRLSLRIRSLNFKLQQRAWESALEKFRIERGRDPRSTVELAPLVGPRVREIATSIGGRGVVMELAVLLTERFPFHYDLTSRSIKSSLDGEKMGPNEVGIHRN